MVHIRDTGKGISPENLKTVFLRFKKINNPDSYRDESESYGLGLAMVKTIADFHGLEVKVESKPGEGSTFTIVFNII
jgi:signal transduction histidine kinase